MLPSIVSAATVPYATDGQLVARSGRVVHARVVSARGEMDAVGGTIRTRVELDVIEDFTGIRDAHAVVVELGGTVGGRSLLVPGVPRLTVGEEVVLCLEHNPHGAWRTVAMSFAAFSVKAPTPGAPANARRLMRQRHGGIEVVGGPAAEPPPPTIAEFRRLVGAIKGNAPWRPVSGSIGSVRPVASVYTGLNGADSDAILGEAFTLLGGGTRWHQVDRGVPVMWYRNPDRPAPVIPGPGDAEIQLGLSAWTAPPTAAIELRYGGLRSAGVESPFCGGANQGVGLVSFEDPTDEIPANVLAIGGGCVDDTDVRLLNGRYFQNFSQAFVVFNRTAELGTTYRTSTNFARIVEHEIGHGIGLGHTSTTAASGVANIMYPACCLAETPISPALGPDDLAGLEFIYPVVLAAQACSYTVTPLVASFPATGGDAKVLVSTGSSCTWSADSASSWLRLTGASSVTGSGQVTYTVASNDGVARSGALHVAGQEIVINQAGHDTDGDGLPDAWEADFGLNALSAVGDDGADGDPDRDGRSNATEFADGTHPRGTSTRYFAEGATSDFFDARFAVFNPDRARTARVLLRFLLANGGVARKIVQVEPLTRVTVRPTDEGLTQAEFATVVEGDVNVVVDRTMTWNAAAYGASGETGVAAPSARWYFAEGATHSGFDLFYLLSNPNRVDADVTIKYLLPAPQAPLERTYRVGAGSRRTVWVNAEDARLASAEMSALVTTSTTTPVVVERAMYLSRPGQIFAAGDDSAGASQLQTRWWFAEGATGTFFDTFLLVVNPDASDAVLEIRYLLPSGEVVSVPHLAPANHRTTIWVDADDPRLADVPLGIEVASTNEVPIAVERAMWWPGPTAATWEEAHVSGGVGATAGRWATADVITGGPARAATYLLVSNTSSAAGAIDVTVTCEEDGGAAPRVRRFQLAARSRFNMDVGSAFPDTAQRRCAALIEGVSPALALIVERATYWDANGRAWAAGVSTAAMPLP